jgi:hypothetical protein
MCRSRDRSIGYLTKEKETGELTEKKKLRSKLRA